MRCRFLPILVVLASCADTPAPEVLDDQALAMAVTGDELYWVAEHDGFIELWRRSPDGTDQLWRRAVAGRSQASVVAGPDGAVVVERAAMPPECALVHWIRRDGTSTDLTAAALCNVNPVAQLDGGFVFSTPGSQATFRFDLTTGAVTTWFDVVDTFLVFTTAQESYAVRTGVAALDLVRVERSGETRTLASFARADRYALSPDAIYWTRPGWDSRPTTVTRVPRDGSGPPVDVLATGGVIEGGQPPFLDHMTSVDNELYVSEHNALYRVDDDELVLVNYADFDLWQLATHDGSLVMLTGGGVADHMRLLLQRL